MSQPRHFVLVEKRWRIAVEIGENSGKQGLAHKFGTVFQLVFFAILVKRRRLVIVQGDADFVRSGQLGVAFYHYSDFLQM